MTFRDVAMVVVDALDDAVERIPVVLIRRSKITERAHNSFLLGLDSGRLGVTRRAVERAEGLCQEPLTLVRD